MISSFHGEYAFLSNFHPSPVYFQGLMWKTVEHLFQASKAVSAQDREAVRNCPTPGMAKRMGRNITKRPDWESIKEDVMLLCLVLKFDQNPDLKCKLIATGSEELVEGNVWHDNCFGQCMCCQCRKIQGRNLLGKLLMQLRKDYQHA